MAKKGQMGFDLVNFIPRLLIWMALVVACLVVGGWILKVNINILDAETQLMIASMLVSPDGFSYTENGRTYPGIIDIDRFQKPVLDKAFNITQPNQKFWGYNLSLYDEKGVLIKNIKENELWHARWKIIAGATGRGRGAAINIVRNYYVTIISKGKEAPGRLVIDITRPAK